MFRNVKEKTVEDGEEENGVEKSSSENNGGAWQSEDDVVEVDEDGEVGNGKKRKKYHRHTADQIRVMEG